MITSYPLLLNTLLGRDLIIEKIDLYLKQVLREETGVRIFELLSRSGVGKSSTSLKISSFLEEEGNVTMVVDSRAIESPLHLLGVFKIFIDKINAKYPGSFNDYPTSLRDIPTYINTYSNQLNNNRKLGVIIFDQFESLFIRSESYTATIDIMFDILHNTKSIVFGLARKSDQYTTYDESSKIDLNRITSRSQPFFLKDFNLEEANILVEKIRDETKKNVSKELRQFILDFSSDGFPWLLKRICAHIVMLIKSGKTQQNIFDNYFQLEDLFSEELDALDELTKDFLLRAIYYMPATAEELSDVFTKEERINEFLTILQHHRLIRLTGRTYDTYNDVLKEYLKTGRISVSLKYVHRSFPKSIMSMFELIIEKNLFSVEAVALELNQRESFIINKIRELKQLGLVSLQRGSIAINDSALRAYKRGSIEELVQSCMKQNGLIREILKVLNEKKQINHEELIDLLKEAMPFTTASRETWSNYSKVTASWLNKFALAYSKNGILILSHTQAFQFEEEYFNYLPTSYIQHIIKLVFLLNDSGDVSIKDIAKVLNRKQVYATIQDAMFLGLIEPTANGYRLTSNGILYVESDAESRREIISNKVSTLEFVSKILEIQKNKNIDFNAAFNLVFDEKKDVWTVSTFDWRRKLINNWLSHSGLITSKRKRKNIF